jgi:hypothetical protein
MEWNDLPPPGPIPQAPAQRGCKCRGHVMGGRRGQACCDRRDTKLQHSSAIAGGWAAITVTPPAIHDIVISPRFPKPYIFSKAF